MKKIYYIDLPNIFRTCDDNSWGSYMVCSTRRAALNILKDHFGIEEKYAEVFITVGEM